MRGLGRGWIGWAAAAVFAMVGACDSGPSGPRRDPNQRDATIGSAGGSLVSHDGLVTLEIPPGALPAAKAITIKPAQAGALGSAFAGIPVAQAYELGPSGLAFDKPVTVTTRSSQRMSSGNGTLSMKAEMLLTTKD